MRTSSTKKQYLLWKVQFRSVPPVRYGQGSDFKIFGFTAFAVLSVLRPHQIILIKVIYNLFQGNINHVKVI